MEKLKELIKNEHALKCALELNKAGIIISIDTKHTDYFHFTNGKRIGYIQFEKHGAFSVSTQYVPQKDTGSGANFIDRTYELSKPFNNWVDMANALFNHVPDWVKGFKFWNDFKQYQLSNSTKWNRENILIIQNDSFYTVDEYFI